MSRSSAVLKGRPSGLDVGASTSPAEADKPVARYQSPCQIGTDRMRPSGAGEAEQKIVVGRARVGE
jgi:hypothetical protein